MRALSILLVLALCACSRGDDPTPDPARTPAGDAGARPWNVLFITLDTTRADRLGCYGYADAATPNLDSLARRGARFTRAYAHAPLTLPTHASLFTGTYPPEHGIHDNGRAALGPDLVTLAELYRGRGYRTGAFIAALALNSTFGLARGFELYDDDLGGSALGDQPLQRRGGEVVDSALGWLRGVKDEPFFCFVHLYDPHAEYDPPAPFRGRHADPYDGEIAYMDSVIGRLLGWLESERLHERTLVLAIADHGEGLGEHGEGTHGAYVFEGTQRVPFLLVAPGRVAPGTLVDAVVEQVDVLPTLLELCGWEIPAQASGRSLVPLLEGRNLVGKPAYAESEYSALNFGWAPLHAVVHGRYKLIEAPTPRLFDLESDPGEATNLAARDPERVAALRRALETLRASMARHAPAALRGGEDLSDRLAGLGYTQSMVAESGRADSSAVDPLDHPHVLARFHEAIAFGHLGDYERMREPLEYVVGEFPDAVGFRALLGMAYVEIGRIEDGIAELERAVALDPRFEPTFFYLGRAHELADDAVRAAEHYRLVLDLDPASRRARVALARILLAQGELDAAREQYERILTTGGSEEALWMNYAGILAAQGRHAELRAALERAVVATGGGPVVRSYLAWTLATAPDPALRDPARAVELAEALAREADDDPHALDVLAAALAAAGRFPRAVATAERALERAHEGGDAVLAAELEDRLGAYREGRSLVDG